LAKGFKESPIEYVGNKEYKQLMEDARLISSFHYLREWVKFAKRGEIGMKYETRYILKSI